MHKPYHTALVALLALCAAPAARLLGSEESTKNSTIELGAFSVSLAVKDLTASQAFYEKLGFAVAGGVKEQNWLILRNGTTTIGLFQGMFERNSLTFNPGWGPQAKPLATFTDVRELQRRLEASGLKPSPRADEASTGPAYLALVDPDGNPVLIDQHVPKPK